MKKIQSYTARSTCSHRSVYRLFLFLGLLPCFVTAQADSKTIRQSNNPVRYISYASIDLKKTSSEEVPSPKSSQEETNKESTGTPPVENNRQQLNHVKVTSPFSFLIYADTVSPTGGTECITQPPENIEYDDAISLWHCYNTKGEDSTGVDLLISAQDSKTMVLLSDNQPASIHYAPKYGPEKTPENAPVFHWESPSTIAMNTLIIPVTVSHLSMQSVNFRLIDSVDDDTEESEDEENEDKKKLADFIKNILMQSIGDYTLHPDERIEINADFSEKDFKPGDIVIEFDKNQSENIIKSAPQKKNETSIFLKPEDNSWDFRPRKSQGAAETIYPEIGCSKKLETMTGLDSLKKTLGLMKAKSIIDAKREKHGFRTKRDSYNMQLLGNPGTGKTTSVSMLTDFLYSIGAIKENRITKADRSALTSKWVNDTENRTKRVLSQAKGGVLFIDEAYALYSGKVDGSEKDGGHKVLEVILPVMEDPSSDIVFVFAGYTEEMKKMMTSNPGLRSRIGRTIHFEDYTADEMGNIFRTFCTEDDYVISDAALEVVKEKLMKIKGAEGSHFGNARTVRNLFQKITEVQSHRLIEAFKEKQLEKHDLIEITVEDVENTPLDDFMDKDDEMSNESYTHMYS